MTAALFAASTAISAKLNIAAVDTLDKLGEPADLPSNLYLTQLSHLKDGATVVGDLYIAAGGAQSMMRVYAAITEAFTAAK